MNFSKIKLQMVKEKEYSYNEEQIRNAMDVVKYINNIENLECASEEYVLLICLNNQNQIIAYSEIAKRRNEFM